MVKIKRKVQKNLPQLIEWGFEQKELPPLFYGSREGSLVQFTPGGWVNITGIEPTDTFTVEEEIEITEDTAIPKMIETYLDRERDFDYVDIHRSLSINNVKDDSDSDCKSITFHIINDDGTHTLIWRDGKLVE